MKPKPQRTSNQSSQRHLASAASAGHDHRPVREWLCTYAAAGLASAVLASSVLMTADAASVYTGGSLPQVLALLVAGLIASFGRLPPLPCGANGRSASARLPLTLLAVLLGWLLLSTIGATWLANGRAAWNGFWHVVALVVFGCFFSQLCRAPQVARAAAQLLVLGTIMLSVHAVHQYAISMPQTRAKYEADPDRALAELEVDAPRGSALRAEYESRLYSSEPLATFALTNSLAVVLSGTLLALGVFIVDQLRRRPVDYLAFATCLVAWLLIMSAGLLTKSRTAFLAVALVGTLSAALAWRLRKAASNHSPSAQATRWWIAGGALAAIAVFAVLVAFLSRDTLILSEAPKSVAFRLEYWQATSKMILDYPLTGVGLGNFQSYYPRYKLETASETIADPHNWLFDIAACCSLPVLALVLISLAILFVRNFSLLRQPELALATGRSGSALSPPVANDADSCIHANEASPLEAGAHQRGLAQALWIGAGAGWLLTAALLLILQEAVDLEAAAWGLVIGGGAWALMRRAPEPSVITVRGAGLAAAVTMLVCLLASGSWQASGIALPLAAWLAVSGARGAGSRRAEDSLGGAGQRNNDQEARSWWQPAAMGLLLVGFIFQTWRPVNSSWTLEQQALAALQRGDLAAAGRSAAESLAADPIDPVRYQLVVQTLVYQAEAEAAEELEANCERAEAAITALLDCDPVPNLSWNYGAETTMTLAAVAQRRAGPLDALPPLDAERRVTEPSLSRTALAPLARRLLERAAEYERGAVERYPSNVALHAQLGVILALLERTADSRTEIETAFALSEATPHLDRKLKKQQVWLPAELTIFPLASIQRLTPGSSRVQAEPLCRFLRNKQ